MFVVDEAIVGPPSRFLCDSILLMPLNDIELPIEVVWMWFDGEKGMYVYQLQNDSRGPEIQEDKLDEMVSRVIRRGPGKEA